MIEGSCLCGAVRFEVHGEFDRAAYCHGSNCRKSHGSAFAVFAACRAEVFHWVSGERERASYESSPGVRRSFCPRCGSSVPTAPPGLPEVFVPASCLDGAVRLPPAVHLFVGSKACWYEISDELPQFDAYPERG